MSLTADGCSGKIRVAVQRVNSASLLVDNEDEWISMDAGVIVYLSFTSDCTTEDVPKAASLISNLPVATKGNWGDGSKPKSLRDFAKAGESIGLMIIPRAGMVSKIKGKSLQYQRQAPRSSSELFYQHFCQEMIRAVVSDSSASAPSESKRVAVSPAVSPSDLFRLYYADDYGSFDDEGLPITTSKGEEMSKSQIKKLKKLVKAHNKKHEKWLKNPQQSEADFAEQQRLLGAAAESKEQAQSGDVEVPKWLTFVKGTFGNRQGLRVNAECGPFTHSFSFS